MLARFERLMQQAVEGSVRRVFATTLQPVQLAKAAAREMEDAQVVGIGGPEVPNVYRLHLAAADHARFQEYTGTLGRELSEYLSRYARERGLRPVSEPRVELCADEQVRAGGVRVEARFVDANGGRQVALEQAREHTRQLRLAEAAAVLPPSQPSTPAERGLVLRDRLGLTHVLDPSAPLVRLGRAADNDVVLPNQRVSRYHAQLRHAPAGWLVYDLASTNGTFVGPRRLEPNRPAPVRAGDVLRLGDHELRVEAETSEIEPSGPS